MCHVLVLRPSDLDPHCNKLSTFNCMSQVTFFSALYMATNPWFFFYDSAKEEICPNT